MQYVLRNIATTQNHKFDETYKKLTLSGSCRGAGLENSVFGKCTRGRIVMSVVENVANVCRESQCSPSYLYNTAISLHEITLYGKTTTDGTPDNKSKPGIVRSFRKIANLKAFFSTTEKKAFKCTLIR